MELRLILQGSGGKRFTLPVSGISSVHWDCGVAEGEGANPERGKLTCYRGTEPEVVVPADSVVSIYRDQPR